MSKTNLSYQSKFATHDFIVALETVRSSFPMIRIEASHYGAFNIIYNKFNISRLSLHVFEISGNFRIKTDSIRDYISYIHVTQGKLHIHSNCEPFFCEPKNRAAMLCSSSPLSLFHEQKKIKLTILHFSRCVLEDKLCSMIDACIRSPLMFETSVDLTVSGPCRLSGIINRFLTLIDNDTSLLQDSKLLAAYEHLILSATLTCLKHNYSDILNFNQDAVPKIIKIAEEYIQDNIYEPIKLTDLSKKTGVGLRSIQLAFKKHRGYSPSFFLKQCKLTRAHQLLTNAQPGTTVLSVALECGFSSQSFFTRCFRERYGFTPLKLLNNSL